MRSWWPRATARAAHPGLRPSLGRGPVWWVLLPLIPQRVWHHSEQTRGCQSNPGIFLTSLYLHAKQICSSDTWETGVLELILSGNQPECHTSSAFQVLLTLAPWPLEPTCWALRTAGSSRGQSAGMAAASFGCGVKNGMTEMPSPIVDNHVAWSTEPQAFLQTWTTLALDTSYSGSEGWGTKRSLWCFLGDSVPKEDSSEVEKRKKTERP